MMAVTVIVAVILLLLVLQGSGKKHQTSPEWRAQHRLDGDAHIYYHNNHDELTHEWDGCNDCMQDRVNELRQRDIRVEYIPGRHSTGDL